ncbi:Dynein heavy chain domain [Phytophthora cactorum]|nr:Dynein heavy chain domain [Phytophthora cactorum]
MVENASDWKAYITSTLSFEAVDESLDIHSSRHSKSPSVKSIQWPSWVKTNCRLLGRLGIHLSLFDSLPLRLIDGLIATHLGEQEMVGLLEEKRGIVRPRVDTVVKKANSSSPLLILTNSSEFAAAGSSTVRNCARRHGIPAEKVGYMSVGHDTIARRPGNIWSYRDKSATTDSGVRNVSAVTRLKEISMSPGWTIIEGATVSAALSVMNALRLQIARLSDVKSTNCDFRLWLVEDLADSSTARDLTLLPASRLFLEPPQTLRQHYEAFLQCQQEEAGTIKKTEHKEEASKRPLPLWGSTQENPNGTAALIYLGRLWGDSRVNQCRQVLTWCFHSNTRDLHNADQDTSLVTRILQLRERLVTSTMAHLRRYSRRWNLIFSLLSFSVNNVHVATIYASNGDTSVTVAALLPRAQRCLEELMTAFPDKTCLSSSIRQLQKQQRESMISGWGKPKTSTSTVEVLVTPSNPPFRQGRASTIRRQQYVLTQLQQQPNSHLIQVELPAMETYLTLIWTNAEMILSLRTDSAELGGPDVVAAIEALVRGNLPPTWRGEALRADNSEGYSTPTRLKLWLRWFRQSVAFFHTHQQCVMALAPHIREYGTPLSKISLMVLPRPSSKSKPFEATTTVSAEDALGSIVLTGLFLSNAEWSVDSCTLLEQVSGSSRSKSLPPLTVYATTRFRSASEGLMLPSSTSTETMTNLSFYRCPLYQSPDHVAALETPLEYVFLPIPVDQNAGAMVVQGAALLLQQFE